MIPIEPPLTTRALRRRAAATIRGEESLGLALARLGFVQADPIRAPAAAQDLILRQRVADYRDGDLDRNYAALPVEEDNFYAYGFVWRELWALLHPRPAGRLSGLEADVLAAVRESGTAHPRDIARILDRGRARNDWGGTSQATKLALESLHRRGLLRVAGRRQGIRLYAPAQALRLSWEPAERARRIAMTVVNMFDPVHQKTLGEILARVRHAAPGLPPTRSVVADLLGAGLAKRIMVDGEPYILSVSGPDDLAEADRVRFLAPFDPVVWDRRRFEHIWGWVYRFEAYVPVSRRQRGYYALPLLWNDSVIGWTNIQVKNRAIDVQLGFVGASPRGPEFKRAIDREIDLMKSFLGVE